MFPLGMMMKGQQSISPTGDIVIQALDSGFIYIKNKWNTNILVNGTPLSSGLHIGISVNTNDIITVSEGTPNVTFRSFNNTYNSLVSGVNSKIISMPPMNKFTIDELGTTAGNNFFGRFNDYGSLTSLPAGSFDISNITNVGNNFFFEFNYYGSLTSLPAGSFNTSNITSTGDNFFTTFNVYGSLTSLPAGSFDISNITSIGDNFFHSFNGYGSLTSLPAGSFDISNITSIGDNFFHSFNVYGSLTSLPAGSFNTSNITSVGINFLKSFNTNGKITRDLSSGISVKNITGGNIDFHYWNGSNQTETISPGNYFQYYKQS